MNHSCDVTSFTHDDDLTVLAMPVSSSRSGALPAVPAQALEHLLITLDNTRRYNPPDNLFHEYGDNMEKVRRMCARHDMLVMPLHAVSSPKAFTVLLVQHTGGHPDEHAAGCVSSAISMMILQNTL